MSDLELVFLNRCVTDAAYLSKAATALNGYRFDGPERNWIWRVAKECVEGHSEAPGFRLLMERVQREFKTDDEVLAAVRVIREIKSAREGSPQSVLDEMVKKHRLQRGSAVAEKLVDALERKDADALTEAIREGEGEIRQQGVREGDTGLLEIAKSLLAPTLEQLSDFVPTGFAYIDRRWKGIKIGEEYLTAGVTNVGKSISMIQTGAKSVSRAIPALHVTTEMDKQAVASRYISRFTGIPEENIREHRMTKPERELFERWMTANWDRMNALLRIERISPNAGTVADIRAVLKARQLATGRVPRLLIIDSPDHLRSQRKYNDKRHESTDIHYDIAAMAQDFGVAVAATTQLEKSWAGKVAPPEAVAEDYNKSRTASWFTSLNELKDDKGGSRLYLYIGKRRAGKKGQLIPLLCDLERMRMDSAPEHDEVEK